jgi:CheY-like chemotaxis protein
MKQRPYDLVLLDLNLPDTRGDMVAEMIKEMYIDVNIVFITGYPELMSEVEKAGDDVEVLLKPIGPESLLEVASRKILTLQ